MSKTLFIIEGYGKLKKAQSILGSDYKVVACGGHIMDLAKGSLSIDIENNYKPIYKNTPRQAKIIRDLKKQVEKYQNIIIATDEDREGEMIAWSLIKVLKLKNPKRITYNELTKETLTFSMKNPTKVNNDIVDAQKARRVLDRLVGYKLSPLLWKNVQGRLSAGRVQSVVVRLIVDKENEIKQFLDNGTESFFKFKGIFSAKNDKPFDASLHDLIKVEDGIFKGDVAKISEEKNTVKFFKKWMKSKFLVANIFDKDKKRNPSPPFTTSTLQQEANRKLGYTAQRTMMAAQRLYEAGFITYLRTDSTHLSNEAMADIKKCIITKFGNKYYRQKVYKTKSKNAQEAHEAIRPTHCVDITIKGTKIGPDEKTLYSLIWKRAVASQMAPAEFTIKSIQILITEDKKHYFLTQIENIKFHGFLRVYNVQDIETEDTETNRDITIPKIGVSLQVHNITGKEDYSKPPYRFSEASLVNQLEKLDIGRPATYVNIIRTIQERGYVRKDNIEGFERKSLMFIWNGKGNLKEEINTMNLKEEINTMNLKEEINTMNLKEEINTMNLKEEINTMNLKEEINTMNLKEEINTMNLKEEINTMNLKKEINTMNLKKEINTIIIGNEKNKFIPTPLGKITTDYLMNRFPKIMDYQFTAKMEQYLDDISNGKYEWTCIIDKFYKQFNPLILKALKEKPMIMDKYTKTLGKHPESGFKIEATMAKWGPIVKMINPNKTKPIYAPIRDPLTLDNIKLKDAVKLFEYPKALGKYGRAMIYLKKGRYSLYLTHGKKSYSVDKTVNYDEAVKIIEDKKNDILKSLKSDKKIYEVRNGPFGNYVKVSDIDKKLKKKSYNVKLPDNTDIDALTVEKLVQIISDHYNNLRAKRSNRAKKSSKKKGKKN